MVCIRCKMVVKVELKKLGLRWTLIELGKAETTGPVSVEKIKKFKLALLKSGLELLENKKNILVEKIKNVVIDMVCYTDNKLKTNFSDYLSEKLNLNYTYLANVFSAEQGNTIEHFIIFNKIKRAKELIGYDELNLSQISLALNYSSGAHFSNQFKKVTGITPSRYKQLSA